MRKAASILVVLLVVCLGLVYCGAQAEKETSEKAEGEKATASEAEKKEPKVDYIGAASCKMCHNTTKMGKQYKVWSEGPHAEAFEVLASDEALEFAKKAGIKGSPQESPKCVKCHSTTAALAKDEVPSKMKLENGVECESCHGPGGQHKKLMAKKAKDETGFTVEITEKTCTGCHNEESPTYKKFEYAKFAAAIAHPRPSEAKKAPAEGETKTD